MEGIKSVLVSKEQIKEKTIELGKIISKDYEGKELVLVGVLKGGFVFMADLVREITISMDLDFMSVSSYGTGTEPSGIVKILKDLDVDITDKHVLIVEDIVDTGLTLKNLKELLHTRGPASVKTCTALDKPSRRKVEIEVEYRGIVIPDEFVIGYGLDYLGKYRNLPDVCIMDPDIVKK
jgi:hypoxanthine phosphoribosyltransferase